MSYGYIKNVSSREWNQFRSENMQGKIRSHSQLCAAEGYLHWQIDPLLTISTKGDLSYRPFISALCKWLSTTLQKPRNQKQDAFWIAPVCLKKQRVDASVRINWSSPHAAREGRGQKRPSPRSFMALCNWLPPERAVAASRPSLRRTHAERGLLTSATIAVSSVWG